MTKALPPPRLIFASLALLCGCLLGFGYYLQFQEGLEPCPMCIFQRLCYILLLGTGAVAFIHSPAETGLRCYVALIGVFALLGAGIAGRQTWLQHLPEDRIPACGPGLDFMLEMYPLADVIKQALRGTGECAEVHWRFLGASIAEWSLLWFLLIAGSFTIYLWRLLTVRQT
jgi:disulfide bond formation protein DsbB